MTGLLIRRRETVPRVIAYESYASYQASGGHFVTNFLCLCNLLAATSRHVQRFYWPENAIGLSYNDVKCEKNHVN